jgi:hypothetical protein
MRYSNRIDTGRQHPTNVCSLTPMAARRRNWSAGLGTFLNPTGFRLT